MKLLFDEALVHTLSRSSSEHHWAFGPASATCALQQVGRQPHQLGCNIDPHGSSRNTPATYGPCVLNLWLFIISPATFPSVDGDITHRI